MTVPHVEIDGSEDRYLKERIEVRHVDETGDEEHRGTGVVRQDVGVLHQWQALLSEGLTEVLRHLGSIGPVELDLAEEALEHGGVLLLLTAPANVEGVEDVVPEVFASAHGEGSPLLFGHGVEEILLLVGAVELATLLALDEIEVNLTIVVGQLALTGMPIPAKAQSSRMTQLQGKSVKGMGSFHRRMTMAR